MTAFPPPDAGKREWLQAIRTLAHSVRKVEANGAKGNVVRDEQANYPPAN